MNSKRSWCNEVTSWHLLVGLQKVTSDWTAGSGAEIRAQDRQQTRQECRPVNLHVWSQTITYGNNGIRFLPFSHLSCSAREDVYKIRHFVLSWFGWSDTDCWGYQPVGRVRCSSMLRILNFKKENSRKLSATRLYTQKKERCSLLNVVFFRLNGYHWACINCRNSCFSF